MPSSPDNKEERFLAGRSSRRQSRTGRRRDRHGPGKDGDTRQHDPGGSDSEAERKGGADQEGHPDRDEDQGRSREDERCRGRQEVGRVGHQEGHLATGGAERRPQ